MLLTVAVLGATGLAYRAGAQALPQVENPPLPRVEKPRSELEALRRENELLKVNLEVVLEKVRAQENELRALRGAASNNLERAKEAVDALDAEKRRVQQALDQQGLRALQGAASNNLERASAAEHLLRSKALEDQKLQRAKEHAKALDAQKRQAEQQGRMMEKRRADMLRAYQEANKRAPGSDAVKQLEDALSALRSAPKFDGQQRAVEALEQALRQLKDRKSTPKE